MDEILVNADKSSNKYFMAKEDYNKLLKINIEKDYKKAEKGTENKMKDMDSKIAEGLNLDDRIEITTKREAYITLKDHKENFMDNPKTRLVKPAKTEIGRISKMILDRIIRETKTKTLAKLWKSTKECVCLETETERH